MSTGRAERSGPPSPGGSSAPREPSSTDAAVTITDALEGQSVDIARRQRRYLAQMSLRVVCFAVGALTWGHLPLAVPITLLAAATVLPYVAVLAANAVHERRGGRPVPPSPKEITR